MPNRRHLLLAAVLAAAPLAPSGAARAQGAATTQGAPITTAQADAFLRQFGNQLIAVVNGPGSPAEKRARVTPIIDADVDVPTIAQFCLGRYWRTATPAQRQQFTALFHQVLITNITGHLGEYRGVSYDMTDTQQRGEEQYVGSIVHRPGAADARVQWVVGNASGRPQIVDVVAEGTSLRLTQRSDYASFMTRNGDNVDALIAAMRRQTGAG